MVSAALLIQLFVIGLTNGAVIALNALAVTLVYSVVRALNLAHGDVFALTTVLAASLITALGLRLGQPAGALTGGLLVALAAALALGAGLLGLIERAAFRPFRSAAGGGSKLAPLIATLGISFILYQAALIWRYFMPSWIPGEHRSVPGIPELPQDAIREVLPAGSLLSGAGWSLSVKDVLVVAAAVLAALAVSACLRYTRTGKALRAVAQNAELARMLGVDPDAIIGRTFLLGGALAGAAAFVFTVYYAHPFANAGAQSGLTAFAAAILGGVGSPLGALAAGLGLGLAAAFSDYFLAARWTPLLLQGLLIALLLWRARGAADEGETFTVAGPAAPVNGRWARVWPWLLLAAAGLYPVLDQGLGWQRLSTAATLAIYALLALGLNLLLGITGLLDLGYAVSFGLGGYAAAVWTAGPQWHGPAPPIDFLLVLAVSAGVAGAFGAVNGLFTRRLRGETLAIVTLALGQMARQGLTNLGGWLGEGGNVAAIPPPHLLTVTLATPLARYALAAGLVVLAALASRRLIASRVGRAWRALSADEAAAAAAGVDPARYRQLAFIVSAALAGVAGALAAATFSYIDPEAVDFRVSAMALAMVILGGAGSVPGAILGAVVIGVYDRAVIPALGGFLAQFQSASARLGSALDPRGLSYLNFGLALYLTIWLRARRRRE